MAQPRVHGRKQSDPHWPIGDLAFVVTGSVVVAAFVIGLVGFLVGYLAQWLG